MKNYAILIVLAFIFFSCGGKKKVDGIALANEVCECRQRGKDLKFNDPEAKKIRKECSVLQGENWMKIIRNKTEEDLFNKRINECTDEMINYQNSNR